MEEELSFAGCQAMSLEHPKHPMHAELLVVQLIFEQRSMWAHRESDKFRTKV